METPRLDKLMGKDPELVYSLYDIMRDTFDREWLDLQSSDRVRISEDFLGAKAEDGCTAAEYASRIGEGNLKKYAECLRIQESK